MTPALIALRFLLAHWKPIAIGIAALLALWWAYSAVWHRGYAEANAEWEARQRAAEAKAAADTAALHLAMSAIDTGITIDMEAISNVRTVYRDRVREVAVDRYRDRDCTLDDGLLGEINSAASAYAAAATGSGQPAVRPAGPAR